MNVISRKTSIAFDAYTEGTYQLMIGYCKVLYDINTYEMHVMEVYRRNECMEVYYTYKKIVRLKYTCSLHVLDKVAQLIYIS